MATTARAPRGRGRRAFALFLAYLLAIFHPSIASPFRASSPTPSATGISAAVVVLVGGLLGRKRLRDNVASSELVSPTLAHIEKISGTPLPVWFLNEYMSLQARVSAELAFEPTFARPAPKPPKTSSGADNNKFIKDPSERLVYVPPDTPNRRLSHFNKSLAAEVPQLDWQRRYTLPPACKQAISVMLRKQAGLRKWRERKAAALRGVARQARTLDRHLKALPIASASVTHLERRVRSVNVTMLCLFVDALRHPDTRLPCCFLTGFNVCGVIEPSNVLRPIPPESSLDDFWLGYNDTMNSNNDWAVAVAKSVTAEARTARGEHLSLLHQCWQLTRKEHDAGLAGKPMTLSELQLKYGRGTHMRCRVIRRHAVKQGQKQMRDDNGNVLRNSDGSARMQDKIRLIDNCKTSLHNTRLQHCAETIAPCNFAYMAHVCEEIRSQAIARGLRHMPQVVFSLDDQFQAYRQIPTADPEMCIVCVYSFDSANSGPRFVEIFGHNFGQRSSVINYYRCPTLCCQIMRHFFAVPQESYFDDFNTPDFKLDDQRDSGAAMALSVLHNDLLGLRLESTKHQPADVDNVFLGVTCDVSHAGAPDPYVEFRPSPRRVDNILNMLNFGARWGLPSHAASVLYGKLGFLLQAAYGRVGRAAIQPLVWRQSEETSAWTPSLHRMKMFLDTLLPRLPPLRWYLARPRRRKVVVYTDAQFSVHRSGLGVVLADTESGTNYIAGALVPPELLAWCSSLSGDRLSKINQCELLAALCALLSFPDLLQGREILFWTDNIGTLKACVDGYSRNPEMAALADALHLCLARLGARVYFAHVPGLDNIADIPSRVPFVAHGATFKLDPARMSQEDSKAIAAIKPVFRELQLPTIQDLQDRRGFL